MALSIGGIHEAGGANRRRGGQGGGRRLKDGGGGGRMFNFIRATVPRRHQGKVSASLPSACPGTGVLSKPQEEEEPGRIVSPARGGGWGWLLLFLCEQLSDFKAVLTSWKLGRGRSWQANIPTPLYLFPPTSTPCLPCISVLLCCNSKDDFQMVEKPCAKPQNDLRPV